MPRIPKAEKLREHIERVAWEIYANRYKPGNRLDKNKLWVEAEKIVRSPIRTTLFASNRPLIKLEKGLWEPLLAWANDQAMLSLLGLIGNLGLILAVATYIGSEKQRRDAEVLNAWQTITSAYGQSGSGGRIQALEFLNASPGANWRRKFPWVCAPLYFCVWERENLAGINLSVPDEDGKGIYLADVNLQGADLENANLQGAFLGGANLQRAFLGGANLQRAFLEGGNLQGANLGGANLHGAFLEYAKLKWAFLAGAKLEGAKLGEANLQEATLVGVNLEGADLFRVNLEGADLFRANLQGANLLKANLEGANLLEANLEGAQGLTQDQLTTAKLCRTTLPNGITLDPNRDCAGLGVDPETGDYIRP